MLPRVLVATLAASVSATTELTPDNFDKVVFDSGKAAFVKFLAPWALKPTWDALAEEFKDSKTVVIADVDCTAEGEPLCSRFNVEGFPTLRSFSPPSTQGEEYEGGRELRELRAHAKSLGPGCSPSTTDLCSDEELFELRGLLMKPADQLETEITELKRQIAAASEAHEELVMSLRAQFERSEQNLKQLKRTGAAQLKLLRAAYGGDYPPCDDDPSFKDKDGEGCASFRAKPAFACGHEGYEESCTRCCATCSTMPNCKRLAAKAFSADEKPKDEV